MLGCQHDQKGPASVTKNPSALLGEVLGRPSVEFATIPGSGTCPFMRSFFESWPPGRKAGVHCVKPKTGCVCSLHRSPYGPRNDTLQPATLVCVCPKRFLENSIIDDIMRECWPGETEGAVRVVCEPRLGDAGNVDLVVVRLDKTGESVRDFLSVELQAVDITGSYQNVLSDVRADQQTSEVHYGFNTKNVYKRFVPQLIQKGFIHQAWGKRLVAVVQDFILGDIANRSGGTVPEVAKKAANLVFLPYSFSAVAGSYRMVPQTPVYTSHNLLANLLYQTRMPAREEFESLLLKKIKTGS